MGGNNSQCARCGKTGHFELICRNPSFCMIDRSWDSGLQDRAVRLRSKHNVPIVYTGVAREAEAVKVDA